LKQNWEFPYNDYWPTLNCICLLHYCNIDQCGNQYIFIVNNSTIFRTILEKNKCDKCNLTIHPNFIGNHKCDHQNCPICKSPVTPSQYWFHVRSHPGHENDSPPPPKVSTFENRQNANYSRYGNYQRN
jgi:hypothetical protein